MTKEALSDLRIVWDSLYDEDALEKGDLIIAFGCADKAVGERAAQLWLKGFAPYVLFSGGLGKGTKGRLCASEAEGYRDIAIRMGVPESHILLETCSTNTGENISFSKALLMERGLAVKQAIVVHQPNMGRRIRATLGKQWADSGIRFLIAPGDRSLEGYLVRLSAEGIGETEMVSNIVGDFERMDTYAARGFQLECSMPEEAWAAFHRLVEAGFDQYIQR